MNYLQIVLNRMKLIYNLKYILIIVAVPTIKLKLQ